jgi:arginine decarboxylase-like protein
MKVKEWVDGALVLEGDILDGAEEAFRDARYVEAFALLHAYIDWWMTDLIQLDGCVRDSSKTYDPLRA